VLPTLIRRKNEIVKQLNDPEIILEVNDKIELKDSLYDIKEEIYKNKKKIKDYYLNNSRFIFDYFENKKEITNGTNKTTILNSFFKVNDKTFDENALTRANDNNVQKFFTNLDQTFININDYTYATDICQSCNKGEMIPVEHEGIMVCNICAKQVTYLIENEKPSYKEPPKEACFYAYKRINHFKEILAQFQAKETTEIPAHVYEKIEIENIDVNEDMKMFETLGLMPQKPFIKLMQPKTVEAEDSQYQALGEKPKWTRPEHKIERNLEASNSKK
jgi:hypothetical protein